jgi:hypothetical protein
MVDRTVSFTGQVPLNNENFLMPQRFGMVGTAMLAEATLGRATSIDGLIVSPTTPASLAIRVDAGQIYQMASLDPSAYGSLPADTQHSILKQGVLMDPATLAISPPGTVGYAQWYLVQVAFQERDAGAVILPYYNADNPSQALSGPNNSGNQQYTERRGVAVVQLKAGTPGPNGSHTRPAADPGWVGLAWVNAIQGVSSIQAQHIFPVPDVPRTRVKLPQIDRAIGFNYTVVRASMALTPEHAGVVVVDSGALSGSIDVTLPPAGSIPGIPLRMTFISRNITPTTRTGVQPICRILPAAGNTTEVPLSVYTNDVVSLISDGSSRWHWVGTRNQQGTIAYWSGSLSIPSGVETFISYSTVQDQSPWFNPSFPTDLLCPYDFARVRVTAGVVFQPNATGLRRARVLINSNNRAGAPWASAPATPGGDFHGISLAGGEMYLFKNDKLQLAVFQNSGGPLSTLDGLAWLALEVLQ